MNRRQRRATGQTAPSDLHRLLDDAMGHYQAGRLPEAERGLRKVLAGNRGDPLALHLLGLVAFQTGRPTEAVERLVAATRAKPDYAEAQNNLGRILLALNRVPEATARLLTAARLSPAVAEIHHHLGDAYLAANDMAAAVAALKRAAVLDPGSPRALGQFGMAWLGLGFPETSQSWHRRTLCLDPASIVSRRGLGVAALFSGDLAAAIECLGQVLFDNPDDDETRLNLATAFKAAGQLIDAATTLRQLAVRKPGDTSALVNMVNAHMDMGRLDVAEPWARRTAATTTDMMGHRNWLNLTLYRPDCAPEERLARHRTFARRFGRPGQDRSHSGLDRRDSERRLTVGYMSSDFREHPVGRNMLPVLEAHDRSRFEIVGYAELARPDGVTERIAKTLDRWRSTLWQSDAEVADAIIRDNVDVLVFLAGHFDVNRLSVAAHKPAPILVSVHDPVTSGFESMDYLVADPVLAPRAGRERFVERVVRVPSFFCHAPLVGAPEPGDPPMGRLGHVTFGSSNNPMKINADVVALWSRVLNAVPAATLRLKYRNAFADPGLCHMFRAAFARHGIDGSRLVFLGGGEPTDVHLNFYRDVDAVLDCFPFTGSTTTFEALWMGVPVVTLIGDSMVHRWSAGILTPLGRRDWVAADAEEYVRIAARLAADADLVADHRRRLRGELAASPLCDGVRLAQQLERLYRSMWRRWCRRAAV